MQQLRLHHCPERELNTDDFTLVDVEPPEADQAPLQLTLRYISVDPYMRTRMQSDGYGYISHWAPQSILSGYGIAEVTASQRADWHPGDWAVGHLPMQEMIAHDGDGLRRAPPGDPPLSWLHPLGMTGFTAWLGMSLLGKPQADDTVLVGAAAGAVGSIAAQLAREAGARVIVSAGRQDKRDWLQRIGFATVLDHRADDFPSQLQHAIPEGLTLNYENLGGTAFSAAIEQMRPGGRIIVCGLISQYQWQEPRRAPTNIGHLNSKGVSIIPFVTPDHIARFPEFLEAMTPRVEHGELHWRLDIRHGGLSAVPNALIGLLSGDNLGKRLVAL
ncbi:MDR family NADP-dependent oxidoreductase [Aidingimonas halophila]|uniref:Enoyl reductase (ER) domain-containing protein n=1 Tax=Aidingimonas halophila TaxID=574349 RepID=A0A1H2Z7A4_9GAMM|nr:NADP-dependent oxidoreductase [Aidingimonas halophila]GHC15387.1 NADP-dependent oxidoreductase [Aidingimonas halophila]SDX12679.1 hypothetical protein SAMN05443545_10445 [Aidingimonas halophila]